MHRRVFAVYDEQVIYTAPHMDHQMFLYGVLPQVRVIEVRRYDYPEIIGIVDIFSTSSKKELFRIRGDTGAYVWQDKVSLAEAVGEFCSRASPFIQYGQRALYLERVYRDW